MRGGHGFGEEDRFFPIRGGDEEWIIQADGGRMRRGDARSDQNAKRRSQANEDEASS